MSEIHKSRSIRGKIIINALDGERMKKDIRKYLAGAIALLLIIGVSVPGIYRSMNSLTSPQKKPSLSSPLVSYQLSNSTIEEVKDSLVLYLASPIALVGGQGQMLGEKSSARFPKIKENTLFVPSDFISQGLKADISIDNAKTQGQIIKNNTTITFYPNNKTMKVNGVSISVPTAPYLEGNVLYVPIRQIAESLGSKFSYYNGLAIISPRQAISIDQEKHTIYDLIYYFNYNNKSSDIDVVKSDNENGNFNFSIKYSFKIDDAVFNPQKPIVYLIDKTNKRLHLINYQTLQHLSATLDYPPERIKYKNGEIFVTLLKQPHIKSTYEDQIGAIGIFSDKDLHKIQQLDIKKDPFDVAIDNAGYLYITPGSGQWGEITSYDRKTGSGIDYRNRFRASSYVEVSPTLNRIYTITTDLVPDRITGYDISNGKFSGYYAPPMNAPSYSVTGRIKLSPDGKYIFSQYGAIVRADGNAENNLTKVTNLDIGPGFQYDNFLDAAFDLQNNAMYASITNSINKYSYDSFKLLQSYQTHNYIKHLNINGRMLVGATDYQILLINSNTDFSPENMKYNNPVEVDSANTDYIQGSTSSVSNAPVTIKDLSASAEYAREPIRYLLEKGVVAGDAKGYFNPKQNLKRSELVKIIVNALGIDTSYLPASPTFKDVPKTHWAYPYVEAAYRVGIVNGLTADTFGADNYCTREQLAVILVRGMGLGDEYIPVALRNEVSIKDMSSISSWAENSVVFAYKNNIMKGTPESRFMPKSTATRQDMATIMYRYLVKQDQIDGISKELLKNRNTRLVLNKEEINLYAYPVLYSDPSAKDHDHGLIIKDGELFAPSIVFSYLGTVYENPNINGRTFIGVYSLGNNRSLLMFPDKTTAYINVDETAMDQDIVKMSDKQITLPVAPFLANKHLYVPLKSVCAALGSTLIWDERYYVAAIKDISSPQFPNLRWLSAKLDLLNAGYNMKTTIRLGGGTPQVNCEATGKYKMGEYQGKEDIRVTDYAINRTYTYSYDVSKIRDVATGTTQYYVKDQTGTTNTYGSLLTSQNGALLATDIEYLISKNSVLSNKLFNSEQVSVQADQILNGQSVTKYYIKLNDRSLIRDVFQIKKFPDIEKLKYIYSGEISLSEAEAYQINNMVMEKYVNKQGQVIKDKLYYSGIKNMQDLDPQKYYQGENIIVKSSIPFEVTIEVSFFDIDKAVNIEAPITP